jgi:hypothetical protein
MLFDLRSKGRRHTVRFVYALLALIMVVGLVGLGVGTGTNNGGLLSLGGNGSSSGDNSLINQQTEAAIKQTREHPNSATAWYGLLEQRYTAAGSGSNFNSTTGVYSNGGKAQLAAGVTAWEKYLTVTNGKPSADPSFLDAALLAGKVYQALGQWSNASTAWQYVIQTGPTYALKGYQCTALNYFAAKNTTQGELASAAALKLTPKASRLEWNTTVAAAKSSQTTAQEDVQANC